MITKIRSLVSKLKGKRKTKTKKEIKIEKKNKVVNRQDVYKKITQRYKEKIKIEFLSRIPREKEIASKINQNKFIVYVDKSKGPKFIIGKSKYCDFVANLTGNQIYFSKTKSNLGSKNSFRNLYDIKLFNDFLIDYAKKEKISKIIINTWMFEEFKGFSKYLGGYRPVSERTVFNYQKFLSDAGYKKVLGYDFITYHIYGINQENKKIQSIYSLPSYVIVVK
jgi:hypothetical protein